MVFIHYSHVNFIGNKFFLNFLSMFIWKMQAICKCTQCMSVVNKKTNQYP